MNASFAFIIGRTQRSIWDRDYALPCVSVTCFGKKSQAFLAISLRMTHAHSNSNATFLVFSRSVRLVVP